jgi:hypothetical protein
MSDARRVEPELRNENHAFHSWFSVRPEGTRFLVLLVIDRTYPVATPKWLIACGSMVLPDSMFFVLRTASAKRKTTKDKVPLCRRLKTPTA